MGAGAEADGNGEPAKLESTLRSKSFFGAGTQATGNGRTPRFKSTLPSPIGFSPVANQPDAILYGKIFWG